MSIFYILYIKIVKLYAGENALMIKKRYLLFIGLVALIGIAVGCGKSKVKIKDFHTDIFGDNVYIFSPEDDMSKVQETLDKIYEKQETAQFDDARYAIYFMPGSYEVSTSAGFYTQIAGLGALPTDTKISAINTYARWLSDDPSNHNATCNFWRSIENVEITSDVVWAVSQATGMRRVQVDGNLTLHDEYGWASGGFLADSRIEGIVDSGSQQQWLSRNNSYKGWTGQNWNIVMAGDNVGWDRNTCENGIIINGDNVTMYALMVEHFKGYQTLWNGNGGTCIMYQSEVPYDVPDKGQWISPDGKRFGYASFKVSDDVTSFYAAGLGVYLYNRDNSIPMYCAMEVPDIEGVHVHNIITVYLNGFPGMKCVINEAGDSIISPGQTSRILDYENGQWR